MKLTTYGAARTVTGMMLMLEHNDHRLLIDCGTYQGHRADAYQVNLNFPFDPKQLDAVVLSHAHIDHSGNLPNLIKQGFEGKIYTTSASVDLAKIMLLDSGHIQEWDIQYVNKKRKKQGLPPVEPIYTQRDAMETEAYFKPVWYNAKFEPIPGVIVTMLDAGHILGSAAVQVDYKDGGEKRRLWFSGDIGRHDAPILRDPVLPSDVDTLVMECTYGDTDHLSLESAYSMVVDAINRTVRRGGKIIIPAFAVGRTQNLAYLLSDALENGDIPDVPVVIDSPLATNASELYRRHSECFDDETWQFIAEHRMKGLEFDNLTFTHSVDESKALNEWNEPIIIISASGMAESGRILHHLKNNIEDGRNTIMILSWQSPDTLGRRLVEGQTKVKIFGEEYFRKAEVVVVNGLSAHAGQDALLEYAAASKKTLKRLILVHGEEDAATAFMSKIREIGGMPEAEYAEKGQTFQL
ncbi:MAG: MBL fold metallo-hydrolase [Anaerolineaceae bacterium]